MTTHIIESSQSTLDGALPGDTVLIESRDTDTPLTIENVRGTRYNPVIVTNGDNPTVMSGDYRTLTIKHSSFFKLCSRGGTGFGFDVSGAGIRVEASTNFEVSGIYAHGVDIGLGICRTSVKYYPDIGGRSFFVQRDIIVHDCVIERTTWEGFYIGSSRYDEGLDPIILGLRVYRNQILDAGRDGIQVGSAWDSEIYDNIVSGAGIAEVRYHQAGIIANHGTSGTIHHNSVSGVTGVGIYLQGEYAHAHSNALRKIGKHGVKWTAGYGVVGHNLYSDIGGELVRCEVAPERIVVEGGL